MHRVVTLIISLALAYTAAFVGSIYTMGAIDTWYATLVKPALSPPNWLFGPVWTVLYGLMAIAAWRVYEKRKTHPSSRSALLLYGAHLVLNALWSVVFFGTQSPLLAAGIIIVLLGCIITLTIRFYHIDRIAGFLFFPYVAWVSFATYLNILIVILN